MRTYLPTLVAIATTLCRYITRHRDTIRANLPSDEARNALDALNTACTVLIDLVELPINP